MLHKGDVHIAQLIMVIRYHWIRHMVDKRDKCKYPNFEDVLVEIWYSFLSVLFFLLDGILRNSSALYFFMPE